MTQDRFGVGKTAAPADDHDVTRYSNANIDPNYFVAAFDGSKKNKARSSSQT